MNIYIFRDSEKVEDYFIKVKKSKKQKIHLFKITEFKDKVQKIHSHDLVYYDISSIQINDLIKTVENILNMKKIILCIMDPHGKVTRIPHLFHHGVSDYLGPLEIEEGLTQKRIQHILKFRENSFEDSDYDDLVPDSKYITVKNGWSDIKSGKEYTFCLMYVSLDHLSELKQNYGHLYMDQLIDKFRNFLEVDLGKIGGKIWKWDDNEGIIIIPYDGKKCEAILSSYILMRNRLFISMEHCSSPVILNYTIFLHLGNLSYQPRGRTGATISESINFIFHASELLSQKGRLYVTDTLFHHIPEGISSLFMPSGNFEGRDLKKMKVMKYE